MNRALLITLITVGVLFLGGIIALTYIGSKTPETFIYKKDEIPAAYRAQMRELNLISENEELLYFYSDGLLDVTDGMYALTDQHLIIYSTQWSEPETIIAFEDISSLGVNYDASFFVDSYVRVETVYGMEVEFPLSSERGRDKEFYELLSKRVEEASEMSSSLE